MYVNRLQIFYTSTLLGCQCMRAWQSRLLHYLLLFLAHSNLPDDVFFHIVNNNAAQIGSASYLSSAKGPRLRARGVASGWEVVHKIRRLGEVHWNMGRDGSLNFISIINRDAVPVGEICWWLYTENGICLVLTKMIEKYKFIFTAPAVMLILENNNRTSPAYLRIRFLDRKYSLKRFFPTADITYK